MEILRLVRGRSPGLSLFLHAASLVRRPVLLAAPVCIALAPAGCRPPDPELLPDERLRSELGLDDGDRVHTIRLRTDAGERADPDSVDIRSGDYVQFVSTDWLVHEVRFLLDSLSAPERDFLERSGQSDSPPLLQEDARFVLTFRDAPPGRYAYRLEGNRAPGSGVIVIEPPGGS